eukprot:3693473-Alexandrium_andersonii.AAC.1
MRSAHPWTLRPESSPGLGGRGGSAVEGVADEALLRGVPDERRARCSKLPRGSPRGARYEELGACAALRVDVLGLVASAASSGRRTPGSRGLQPRSSEAGTTK